MPEAETGRPRTSAAGEGGRASPPARRSSAAKIFLRRPLGLIRPALGLSVAAGAFSGGLMILQAWLLASMVDAVLFEGADLDAIWSPLLILVGILFVRALCVPVQERAAFRAAAHVKQQLRQDLHARLLAHGPALRHGGRSGRYATLLTDGVEALEAYYARFLPAMVLAALLPLAILGVVLPLDWLSALILAVTAPLIPLAMILIAAGAERRNRQQWAEMARLGAYFLDLIQNLTTIKLFQASRREVETVGRLSNDYRRRTMSVLRLAFLSALALEFLSTLSIALVAVLIGFRLLWGEMDFARGFYILLLAPEFYLPLRMMGLQYHARLDAVAAAEQLAALEEELASTPALAQEPRPGPAPEPASGPASEPAPAEAEGDPSLASRAIAASVPTLRLENVTLCHDDLTADAIDAGAVEGQRDKGPAPGSRGGLHNLSLTFHPGETVAIVGPTGAGKSTLLDLLLGFVTPQEGRVLVDGRALADLRREVWWQRLAWVPQTPTLFALSLADNIRLGREDASDAAVREAARLADADGFISALPEGYATRLGEGGLGLSGGQIQRIALARAFLRQAPLVLLDEPTASLDRASEAAIQAAMARLASGAGGPAPMEPSFAEPNKGGAGRPPQRRSLIIIAHRLATIRAADRIIVLDQGRKVAEGTHAALLAEGGLYARMVAAQSESGGRPTDGAGRLDAPIQDGGGTGDNNERGSESRRRSEGEGLKP